MNDIPRRIRNCQLFFESPIEEYFAEAADKYFRESVDLHSQVEVPTTHGIFRLDFVAAHAGRIVGLEMDGAEFHDYARDLVRDALIPSSSGIDTIYRFRGTDLVGRLEDSLLMLLIAEPEWFDERATLVLTRISSLLDPEGEVRTSSEYFDVDNSRLETARMRRMSKSATPELLRRLQEFAAARPTASIQLLAAELRGIGVHNFLKGIWP